MSPTSRRNSRGLTLVEVLVAVGIAGILFAIIFGAFYNVYLANITSTRQVIHSTDTKTALNMISRDVVLAVNFAATNTTDPVGPTPPTTTQKWTGNTYSYAGSGESNRILIISRYATSSETSSGSEAPTRQLMLALDCKTPTQYTVIYYVKDSNLYRRVVARQSTATNTCSNQFIAGLRVDQKQTCPSTYTNTVCLGKDGHILSGVTSFKATYFTDPNDLTTAITYPNNPANAVAVRIEISAETGVNNNRTTATDTRLFIREN